MRPPVVTPMDFPVKRTGMAATSALMMAMLDGGDHCVVSDVVYGGTHRLSTPAPSVLTCLMLFLLLMLFSPGARAEKTDIVILTTYKNDVEPAEPH